MIKIYYIFYISIFVFFILYIIFSIKYNNIVVIKKLPTFLAKPEVFVIKLQIVLKTKILQKFML